MSDTGSDEPLVLILKIYQVNWNNTEWAENLHEFILLKYWPGECCKVCPYSSY